MSDLAEKFKELNDAVKPHNVGSAEHREAVRTLEIFVHANADEMIETLAEIARLRADVERLRGAIAPVVAEINNRWADVHDESWSADYHCEFEMTVAECRTLLLAAAALADTADKQL